MDANTKQVDGDHYKSSYEHWDFVEDEKIPYLEAVAIKYITRWRNKNGQVDLDKGVHYCEKLLERIQFRRRSPRSEGVYAHVFRSYQQQNQLTDEEMQIIRLIVNWVRPDHIREAIKLIPLLAEE